MDPFKMKILNQYGMHPIHYQMNLGCFNELVLIVNYAENWKDYNLTQSCN